jgi:hypothetical protein
MPQDAAAKLEQILTEADDLIRQRLEESGLEVMHVTLAITRDGMGVVRTNVGPDLLRSMGEELTFSEVRRLLSVPKDQFLEEVMPALLAHEDLPNITRNAAVAMSAGDEELGSLLTTVGRHLRFMDHSAIAAAFGGSSLVLDEVTTRKMTIYVVMPSELIDTYSRFLRVILGVAAEAIMQAQKRDAMPVALVIDEFGQLGYMKKIEEWLPILRGYGIRLWLIVQDFQPVARRVPQVERAARQHDTAILRRRRSRYGQVSVRKPRAQNGRVLDSLGGRRLPGIAHEALHPSTPDGAG